MTLPSQVYTEPSGMWKHPPRPHRRRSLIRTYWLACLLILSAACAIALPDYWVAMDPGACEAEGC